MLPYSIEVKPKPQVLQEKGWLWNLIDPEFVLLDLEDLWPPDQI